MVGGRPCVLLIVLVSVKMVVAQPLFGTQWWCDTFCDDDDDDYEDLGSLFGCDGCESDDRPRRTTTVAPGMQQPFNIMIPPANGLNLSMTNTGSSWLMNFMPWAAKPAAATTAPPPTTVAGAGNGTAPTTAKRKA